MQPKNLLIRSIIFLTICLNGNIFAQYPVSVSIPKKVWVSQPRIYLKDVATINAPAHLSEKVASIYLTYAPKPGKSKFVKGEWVDSRIRALGFYDQIHLTVPEKIEIVRASQIISEEDYLNYFSDYIAKHIGPNVRFEISRFQVKGDTPLPVGPLTVKVQHQTSVNLRGYVSLTVSILVNDQFIQRVGLSGWIDRFEDIVCATKPLARNQMIARQDVKLITRNVSKIKDTYYTRTEDVIGKQIQRKVGNGEIIFSSMIEIPPLIYKGDKVTIIAESRLLLIKTTGIALSDGYAGEQIRVRNTMSNKVIQANVVNPNTVKVQY
jgi:flagella basal body P-ring formation protein FlgA